MVVMSVVFNRAVLRAIEALWLKNVRPDDVIIVGRHDALARLFGLDMSYDTMQFAHFGARAIEWKDAPKNGLMVGDAALRYPFIGVSYSGKEVSIPSPITANFVAWREQINDNTETD